WGSVEAARGQRLVLSALVQAGAAARAAVLERLAAAASVLGVRRRSERQPTAQCVPRASGTGGGDDGHRAGVRTPGRAQLLAPPRLARGSRPSPASARRQPAGPDHPSLELFARRSSAGQSRLRCLSG